ASRDRARSKERPLRRLSRPEDLRQPVSSRRPRRLTVRGGRGRRSPASPAARAVPSPACFGSASSALPRFLFRQARARAPQRKSRRGAPQASFSFPFLPFPGGGSGAGGGLQFTPLPSPPARSAGRRSANGRRRRRGRVL